MDVLGSRLLYILSAVKQHHLSQPLPFYFPTNQCEKDIYTAMCIYCVCIIIWLCVFVYRNAIHIYIYISHLITAVHCPMSFWQLWILSSLGKLLPQLSLAPQRGPTRCEESNPCPGPKGHWGQGAQVTVIPSAWNQDFWWFLKLKVPSILKPLISKEGVGQKQQIDLDATAIRGPSTFFVSQFRPSRQLNCANQKTEGSAEKECQ